MPQEGGRGAALTPLGVIWVNAPRRGQRGGVDAPWGEVGERPQRGREGEAIGETSFF